MPFSSASSIEKRFLPSTCVILRQTCSGVSSACPHPSVFLRHLPAVSAFSDADNDVQTVITCIKTLSVACTTLASVHCHTGCFPHKIYVCLTLRAVSDQSKSVILEVLLQLGYRPVSALVNSLFRSSEIKSLDSTAGLLFEHEKHTKSATPPKNTEASLR